MDFPLPAHRRQPHRPTQGETPRSAFALRCRCDRASPTPALPASAEPSAAEPSAEVRVDFRIIAGAAALLILLFTLQNYLTVAALRGQSLGRTFGLQIIIWTTWVILSPLIFAAARGWRRNPRVTPGAVISQLVIGFGVALLHSLVAGTARWALGVSVYDDLDVVLINYSVVASLASNVLRYWLIASAYHAVAYRRELRARDLRAARLEGSLVQARLEALQGRLRPHFLFNTLNSIGALIREQPAAAEQMLGSLSELLRASLNAEPSREVTFERELDLVRQLVSIQQMRFQDRLSVSIDAAPDVLHAYVPHLVLQPLVENAIRHGIAPRDAARARADWRRPRGHRLRLIVEDDGIGMDGASSRVSGRVNGEASSTQERESGWRARRRGCCICTGGRRRLVCKPGTPSGFVATVNVPFHTSPVVPGGSPLRPGTHRRFGAAGSTVTAARHGAMRRRRAAGPEAGAALLRYAQRSRSSVRRAAARQRRADPRAESRTSSFSTFRCRGWTASACCARSRQPLPLVIFVTAHDEHAIRAFDVHAVDYVLKPVVEDPFREAVRRADDRLAVRRRRAQPSDGAVAGSASGRQSPSGSTSGPAIGSYSFAWTISTGLTSTATTLRCTSARTHLLRETLGDLERRLPARFLRIHRSSIVQTNRIQTVQPWFKGDYVMTLRDGTA